MAPTIKSNPVDARTDVYALGVLTFYFLTGELPFTDPHLQTLQLMVLNLPPPRPSSRRR